ncbi:hypothetical protein HK100_012277, partial [Physocladia obscura]
MLHNLADELQRGSKHLETMFLIDMSSSMTVDPHKCGIGPDNVRRVHDQPCNVDLVKNLVQRLLKHM